MEKNVKFSVSVIECNADKFMDDFGGYVQAFRDGYMDNKIFYLNAPQSVKDDISKLSEEGIEVGEYN